MNGWDWIIYAALALAILIGFGILAARNLWNLLEQRIQRMLSEALERPTPKRYLDIDAEYRALVLEEHNRGDH